MSFIVAVTGCFGLLTSYVALQFGLDSIALRYPFALTVAYAVFFMLLWLWLRAKAEDYLDLADISNLVPSHTSSTEVFSSAGGGNFGGGGASGSFDSSLVVADESFGSSISSATDAVGAVAESDELVIPLVAIVFAIGIALASLYVVYIAPVLLAEVLVDGAISYALFRNLRSHDSPHWVASAFQRTIIPFVITAVVFAATGAAMSAYAPEATSIGQVLKHARQAEAK